MLSPPSLEGTRDLKNHYSLVIVGAGASGLAHALALSPIFGCQNVALLEAKDTFESRSLGRCLALNHGNLDFLSSISPSIQPETFITQVHVQNINKAHRLSLNGQPVLGASIREGHLLDTMSHDLHAYHGVMVHGGKKVERLCTHRYGAQLFLMGGQMITADYVVLADGGSLWPHTRYITKDYQQTAWTGVVEVTRPATPGHAFEYLTSDGPCAWIPLAGNRYGFVWMRNESSLVDWMDVSKTFSSVFSSIIPSEPMRSFPLSARYTDRSVYGCVILAGHSAHQLHPIAAQGFNLTLRDVRDLVTSFRRVQYNKFLLDPHYHQRRWRDLQRTLSLTSVLSEMLHPRIAIPQNFGLKFLNACFPLKKYVTKCLTMT